MDFEFAEQRLKRDQDRHRSRASRGKPNLSDKAKRQAEYRRKQEERQKAEREAKKRILQYQQQYMKNCDRSLNLKPLLSSSSATLGNASTNGLLLTPTSIHGEGDKIALPTSVLHTLTSGDAMNNNDTMMGGNPWMFRIGLLNPNYSFPASPMLNALRPPPDDAEANDDENEDDYDEDGAKQAYLDELSHKYISYTHCTVVEFTQDEGNIGIPQLIADALLKPKSGVTIPTTRTVDPSAGAASATDIPVDMEVENSEDGMEKPHKQLAVNSQEDKTPGHLAWGAFDIPDQQLEVSLVKLPKGRGCTLVPTREAVQNNFYGLKDVKLVLEQSLTRTRGTLDVGDTVSTWHRGTKFDLTVTKVIPSAFCAITCINTDIEVDIGAIESEDQTSTHGSEPSGNALSPSSTTGTADIPPVGGMSGGTVLGTGNSLASTPDPSGSSGVPQNQNIAEASLLPEPPQDEKENICTIQIRSSAGTGKRRFRTDLAKVKDLFEYASFVSKMDGQSLRLVTSFPRRVITMGKENAMSSLDALGIKAGREVFMAEMA